MSATPAPGWHPDPEQPQTWRYWDGAQWTEQRAPMPAPAAAPRASDGLVIAGYLIALLLPLVGGLIAFIIGVILLARDRVGHGLGVITLSVISPVIWFVVILGGSS